MTQLAWPHNLTQSTFFSIDGAQRNPDLSDFRGRARHSSRPINSLPLPLRGRNALLQAGLRGVGDVVTWTARDLKTLPNFGSVSLAALLTALAELSLSLREPEASHIFR